MNEETTTNATTTVVAKKPLLPDTFLGGQTVHNLIIIGLAATSLYLIIKCTSKMGK